MRGPHSARQDLRAATAHHHDQVDSLFSALDLGVSRDYACFLEAQASAHVPVEEALMRGGVAALVPDWPQRQRSHLLRADLADLGLDLPAPAGAIDFSCDPAVLGGLYVLEGSRLGGAMLKRSVPAHFPSRFLGGGTSAGWRDLLAMLEQQLVDPRDLDTAIDAASRAFLLFQAAGQHHLKVD